MLQNPAWQKTDLLARAQLAMFHALGDKISLTDDDRRRALDLDDRTWMAWNDFLSGGPLPAEPPLPDMLRRLADTAFLVSVVGEDAQAVLYPPAAPPR